MEWSVGSEAAISGRLPDFRADERRGFAVEDDRSAEKSIVAPRTNETIPKRTPKEPRSPVLEIAAPESAIGVPPVI
ncbi:hypothetical protein BRC86_05320 [Halobacteriales archaeon QS_3_64_16]|nr:MAG: hypothetical protein BRC86_05320 [Halobacteriales archaeon QS_3_64_16]